MLVFKMYKFNRESSDRNHYGVVAQDILQLMEECGITQEECDLVVENNGYYSVRYTELLCLMAWRSQQKQAEYDKRLEELAKRIETLETLELERNDA